MNEQKLLVELKLSLKNFLDDYQDKLKNSDRIQLDELESMQKEIEAIRNNLIENWARLDKHIKLLLIKREI